MQASSLCLSLTRATSVRTTHFLPRKSSCAVLYVPKSHSLGTPILTTVQKEVLSKNFGVPTSAFDKIPQDELYIFRGTPAPKDIEEQNVKTSAGLVPRARSYSYHFSEQPGHEVAGGSVKIVDSSSFPIAANFSAAVVTVRPGGMREIHWHPTSDEWTFFIKGQGRATLFTAPDQATTFGYRAGDVGYFPQSNSHYIENTGNEDLQFLEVLQAPQFTGMFVNFWESWSDWLMVFFSFQIWPLVNGLLRHRSRLSRIH